jgi:hypothetical protein
MTVKIENITSEKAEQITEALDSLGFMYDEAYTTLYGKGWDIVGIEIMSAEALTYVLPHLADA